MSDTMYVPTGPTDPSAGQQAAAPQYAPAAVATGHEHDMYVPKWLFVALLSVTVLFLFFAGLRLFVGVARHVVAFGNVRRSFAAGPAFQRQAGGFRRGSGYVPGVPSDGGYRR